MLTRRNALLGLGLATAGCAGELMGGRLPPGIQTGNIAPDDNLVLGPDENILVGMVGQVTRLELAPGQRSSYFSELVQSERSGLSGNRSTFMVLETDRNRQFALQMSGAQPDPMTILQNGVEVQYNPFAVRVPKGPYRILAILSYAPSRSTWNWTRLQPMEFNVRPGTVAYLGRFGEITQIINFSPSAFESQTRGLEILRGTQPGDSRSNGLELFLARAPEGSSLNLPRVCAGPTGHGGPPSCRFSNLFFLSNAHQDLPILRQRFPRLTNAQIMESPLAPAGTDGWKRWPEVLRPLSVT